MFTQIFVYYFLCSFFSSLYLHIDKKSTQGYQLPSDIIKTVFAALFWLPLLFVGLFFYIYDLFSPSVRKFFYSLFEKIDNWWLRS